MENLNEDNIKRSTLSFLKSYYKYKERKGETEATMDMRGQGGIIADGLYAYTDENDNRFLSTFEATSNDTKSEVSYKILYRKLAWDGFAISSFLATAWFIWRYQNELDFLQSEGYWWIATVLIAIVLTLLLIIVLTFRRLKRYRYIYAVEQFKRYHANEQWISIGEDVFASQDDRKFIELKDQCIRNGFGLIKVDEKLNPQLIITPSRKDTFQKKRKAIQFVGVEDFTNRIKGFNYKNWLGKLKLNVGTTNTPVLENMLRFRGKNYPQKAITLCSFLIVAGIFIRELTRSEVIFVDEKRYPQLMIDSLEGKDIETTATLALDTLFVQRYDSTAIPYLDLMQLADQSDRIAAVRKRGYDIVISTADKSEYIIYHCARFYNIESPKYIIEDGVYSNIEDAIARMEFLKTKGITTTALWLGCFANQPLGYTVYFDEIQNNEEEASLLYYEYNNKIKEIESVEHNLKTRILVPDNRFRVNN